MPSDEDVTQRAESLQAMTGLTEPEFTALLPPFEDALAAYLQDRTIDGQPRTSRRYSAYGTLSFTHDSRQTTLHSDVCETESHSRTPRTALWDVPIKCQ